MGEWSFFLMRSLSSNLCTLPKNTYHNQEVNQDQRSKFYPVFASNYTQIIIFNLRFAAEELAAEPYLRQQIKKEFFEKGTLTTAPTEKGKKDLDVFHPSYRVKNLF